MTMSDETVAKLWNEAAAAGGFAEVIPRFADLCYRAGQQAMREAGARLCESEFERVTALQTPSPSEFAEGVNLNLRMTTVLLPDLAQRIRALPIGEDRG